MRNVRMTIWVVVAIVFVSGSQVLAWTQYNDGGTHDIITTINDDVWVDWEAPGMGTTVNFFSGGAVTSGYDLQGHEDSIINILGGSISDNLSAYNRTQITMSDGGIGDGLWAYGDSQVTVSGGLIGSNIQVYDNTRVDMSGGSINSAFGAWGNTQVDFSGGSIGGDFGTRNNSQAHFSGGSINRYLHVSDTSTVTVSGGSIKLGLWTHNASTATFTGGSIDGVLDAHESSRIDFSGGSVGAELISNDGAILTIYGSDFAVDGQPVGYGELTSIFGGGYSSEPARHLTGTLASAEMLNNDFYIGGSATIVLIPEPTTLILLGLGGLLVRKRSAH